MQSFFVPMQWKKETKGTHVYENVEPDARVTQLYVKKDGDDAPKVIMITIEEVEE